MPAYFNYPEYSLVLSSLCSPNSARHELETVRMDDPIMKERMITVCTVLGALLWGK
jgi:hypothetical protein